MKRNWSFLAAIIFLFFFTSLARAEMQVLISTDLSLIRLPQTSEPMEFPMVNGKAQWGQADETGELFFATHEFLKNLVEKQKLRLYAPKDVWNIRLPSGCPSKAIYLVAFEKNDGCAVPVHLYPSLSVFKAADSTGKEREWHNGFLVIKEEDKYWKQSDGQPIIWHAGYGH